MGISIWRPAKNAERESGRDRHLEVIDERDKVFLYKWTLPR